MKTTAKPILLRECDCLQSGGVDEQAPVIQRVKILGWESKNRRRYLPESVSRGMYEGMLVNLDHPESPNTSRQVKDRFGRLVNVVIDGEGCWGDLHYNPKHPLAEAVKWAAANDPALYGLSHNAMGTGHTKDGVFIVEKVVNVRSVDLVADPATTRGLHESMEPDQITPAPGGGEDESSVDDLATHVSNAVQALVKDEGLDLKTKMRKIKAALKLLEEPGTEKEETEEEEEEEEEETPPAKKKEEEAAEESVKILRASKDPAIKALVERLDRYEAAGKLSARRERALQLCEDAQVPKVLVTAVFVEQLVNAKDEKAMKQLIEDRRQVASIKKPISTGPNPTSKGGKQITDVKSFARQLREGR